MLIFMLNISASSPKFYGVAVSFGEHGLNICVANTEPKSPNKIIKKDKLPGLRALDMGYSRNPALDPVCDFIENTIADNLRKATPGLPFDIRTGNYSRASEELRKQAASVPCPFPDLEKIAHKAASGDEVAQK